HPTNTDLPLVREYQADLKAIDPNAKIGFGSLEGYISARILTIALEKNHDPLTRESIVDALEKLGTFDLGLGEKLSYGPSDHEASDHVWPTILRDGVFVPFDWKDIGGLIKK